MVSPAGGFQVIADINAYTAWVGTLRQSALTPYFTALQMVANLYIVDSPKDLAGLVKDVQRYGGTLRGEECVRLARGGWRADRRQCVRATPAADGLAPAPEEGRLASLRPQHRGARAMRGAQLTCAGLHHLVARGVRAHSSANHLASKIERLRGQRSAATVPPGQRQRFDVITRGGQASARSSMPLPELLSAPSSVHEGS